MSEMVTLRTGAKVNRRMIFFILPILKRLLKNTPQVLQEYLGRCKQYNAPLSLGAFDILRRYELLDRKGHPYDPGKQVALAYVEEKDGQMRIRTGIVVS